MAAEHDATRDLCTHGHTALTAPLMDRDALAAHVVAGIEHPDRYAEIRHRAAQTVRDRSDVDVVGPRLAAWLERIAAGELDATVDPFWPLG